jgi:hypothetical protein
VIFIQDYGDGFTELVILGQKYWSDDDINKRCLIRKGQDIILIDTVIEESVSDN